MARRKQSPASHDVMGGISKAHAALGVIKRYLETEPPQLQAIKMMLDEAFEGLARASAAAPTWRDMQRGLTARLTDDVPRETDVAIAFLMLDDKPRLTCVDCCLRLEARGMVRRLYDQPTLTDGRLVIFGMAPPYTLEDCRAVIRDRHTGGGGEPE